MSVALESLMRHADGPAGGARRGGGLASFLAIGAGGALTFVGLSSLAVALAGPERGWLASALCYAALIGPVYLLHRRFSFRSEAAHRQALPRYLAVQAMALGLAALFGWLLHGRLALPGVPASILVIALTSGMNYLVLRGWAFARSDGGFAA